jgi:bifunctional UDP-N-acetylglucosamine pyrophosphorylase/glucosamine-1-phosphate N-acetyltransferase
MNQAIGVILAAGKGTRMKSDLPKVLCQVGGQPLVKYVIDSLRAAGVGRLVAVVGYREDLVRAELGNESDLGFAVQSEQLGTGHAVMMCREALIEHQGPVVVVAGDSPMLQPDSISSLLEDFRANRPACLLGTLNHPNPQGLGRIVRDSQGKFLRIVEEKDASEEERALCEVNMSTYVFDCQKMLAALGQLRSDNKQQEYYITDLPEILLDQGEDVRALACLQPIEALSVNTVEQLAEVEAALKSIGR